jgi:RNA polymerase sigma-70 factor (ECF subfamily)
MAHGVRLSDPTMPEFSPVTLPPALTAGLDIIAARALCDADDARDAVQETLSRAVTAVREGRLPAGVALEAFVYGIARHVIADVHRRRGREAAAPVDPGSLHAPEPSPLDVLIVREERERMARALAALSQSDRDLLERCFVRGERVAAIAEDLGEPADRVRKRKSRALARLRQDLRGDRPGHEAATRPTLTT